jgi:hypothetical protein
VSVFYLLPPRPLLGDCFADFLHAFFPGLTWDRAARARLADLLGAAVLDACPSPVDVYLVHRDDLPAGEAPGRALADGFGAEEGDEVVEVRPGARPGEMTTRRWRVTLSSERAGLE